MFLLRVAYLISKKRLCIINALFASYIYASLPLLHLLCTVVLKTELLVLTITPLFVVAFVSTVPATWLWRWWKLSQLSPREI